MVRWDANGLMISMLFFVTSSSGCCFLAVAWMLLSDNLWTWIITRAMSHVNKNTIQFLTTAILPFLDHRLHSWCSETFFCCTWPPKTTLGFAEHCRQTWTRYQEVRQTFLASVIRAKRNLSMRVRNLLLGVDDN